MNTSIHYFFAPYLWTQAYQALQISVFSDFHIMMSCTFKL